MLKRMKMAAGVAALAAVFMSVASAKPQQSGIQKQLRSVMKCASCKKQNCPIPHIRKRIQTVHAAQFD